ncbi:MULTISPECIES: MarR family winged helix-turn-helix transcriptional regulator [Fusobacterium]|uniref:MarR family winged helix-turn-helix transcriptional regulator n=1 Tax=Fusobacterium TaxID=848 RepID=UPI0001A2B306|nr:MarR family transcriptional regulator [Fusobacterium mortiferum]EEO36263.1 transcriptional regulator, MarR family [Fusobacterium mortiferum ATCC 9817]MCI6381419.1 MarR family transcriptional regulator [Fusobacterium mortiferum]MCI7188195.1 MarR family transcriptional regulator [Fusobacterium mortiferum]MDD7261238.1 MarR family transcriptional regulator [Fusobacterium mortiferum]
MRNIINSLGYDICYTARKIYQFLTKEFKDFDITPEQFVVLVKLSEENGISQMELANRLDKDKNNVKAMVDNLSKKGYLIKKRIKPIKELILYILQKKPKLLFLK